MIRKKTKLRKWLFALLHIVGFVLLWFVIRDLEWSRFYVLLKTIPFWKYLAGIGVLCIVYAIKALRWHLLNRSFGIETTWKMALIFYLSAGFMSVITPGRLGEFAKIYFLKRKYKIDLPSATSSVFLDRIWDVLVLSFAAGISVVVLLADPGMNVLTLVLIALLFLASLLVILIPSILFVPLLFMIRRFSGLHSKLQEVFRLWKESRFRNFVTSLSITALAFLMLAAIPVLFSYGTSYPILYRSGIGAISISNILSFLPVTIAGFGTRELVFVEVWKLSSYPKEIALSVSTAYFMITYMGSLLIGGLVYLLNIKHLYRPAEIRKMTGGE
ncbi:MAG: lysylphosphatidylglycerol synthase transmembrane domain-containing protein [Bacteroidota bacterium]